MQASFNDLCSIGFGWIGTGQQIDFQSVSRLLDEGQPDVR